MRLYYSVLTLWVYSVTLFPGTILMLILPKSWRPKLVCIFWRAFGRLQLFVTRLKYETIDLRSEELKKDPPSGLYISNHQSFLDIVLLAAHVQIPPIMKKEVMYIPLFGLTAWVSGSIVVDRRDPSSRKRVLRMSQERMTSGKALQYYPEGTRSRDGSPKPFEKIKTALILFAYKNDVPVFPVTMVNTNKVLSTKGHFNRKVTLRIKLAKELYPKDFPDAKSFALAAWNIVLDDFEKLSQT